ncbi:MotE family protein [Brevibacillus daliensis]|uniref:MotE family protein n=1 Tax=Brevibacillus daliensis TaxID=2892995 RepID=UPI001E55D537|nr:MotE family protein [Brevibacillus daliensis]
MEEVQEERGYGRWEFFFYIILIPALFTSLLLGIILSFSGYDVIGGIKETINKIPFIEKVIDDGPNTATNPVADEKNKGLQTEQVLEKNKQETAKLEEAVNEKEATIQALQTQVKELQRTSEQKRVDEEERQKQFQSLAKTYATMSPKNAAAILENLSNEEAVVVLAKMKTDVQSQILAKMDPKKAADLSILIKDQQISKDDDIAALQQRVIILTKALGETRDTSKVTSEKLVASFNSMNTIDAAKILSTLYKTNTERALSILSQMADGKRGEILGEISKTDAGLAARITNALPR